VKKGGVLTFESMALAMLVPNSEIILDTNKIESAEGNFFKPTRYAGMDDNIM
jgi:hypothetical protein